MNSGEGGGGPPHGPPDGSVDDPAHDPAHDAAHDPAHDAAHDPAHDPAHDTASLRGTITTVHCYPLPLGREKVWARIAEVSCYRAWWPWLRSFEAVALAEGEEWRCEVQPPVPYPVRFRVAIEHIEVPALVRARILGDVIGHAVLALEDAELEAESDGGAGTRAGCVATLRSSLAPGNTALQLVSRFAGPVARFGHDWVLNSGARQFIARAVEPVAGD